MSTPPKWEVVRDLEPGIAMVARAPYRNGFAQNITVALDQIDSIDLVTWQESSANALLEALGNAVLIDVFYDEDAYRRTFSYSTGRQMLVLEQWFRIWQLPDQLVAVTFSATSLLTDYFATYQDIVDIISTWQPGEGELL